MTYEKPRNDMISDVLLDIGSWPKDKLYEYVLRVEAERLEFTSTRLIKKRWEDIYGEADKQTKGRTA